MDDDIFVHIFNFHKLIQNVAKNTSSLICYVQQQMPVTRDEGSKWMVRIPEYPLLYYEDYCSGMDGRSANSNQVLRASNLEVSVRS